VEEKERQSGASAGGGAGGECNDGSVMTQTKTAGSRAVTVDDWRNATLIAAFSATDSGNVGGGKWARATCGGGGGEGGAAVMHRLPSAVDTLAAAAAALVTDMPVEQWPPARPVPGTLEAIAAAAALNMDEEEEEERLGEANAVDARVAAACAIRSIVSAAVDRTDGDAAPMAANPTAAVTEAGARAGSSSEAAAAAATTTAATTTVRPPLRLKFFLKKPCSSELHHSTLSGGGSAHAGAVSAQPCTAAPASDTATDTAIARTHAVRPGDPEAPSELCSCVPTVPDGWMRWEVVRLTPARNGSWGADCYYSTPAGPRRTLRTFILRSDKEISNFLSEDAKAAGTGGGGDPIGGLYPHLTVANFLCSPFTRKHKVGGGRGGEVGDAGALAVASAPKSHKWRAALPGGVEAMARAQAARSDLKRNTAEQPQPPPLPSHQPQDGAAQVAPWKKRKTLPPKRWGGDGTGGDDDTSADAEGRGDGLSRMADVHVILDSSDEEGDGVTRTAAGGGARVLASPATAPTPTPMDLGDCGRTAALCDGSGEEGAVLCSDDDWAEVEEYEGEDEDEVEDEEAGCAIGTWLVGERQGGSRRVE